jgi:hypothetical protein
MSYAIPLPRRPRLDFYKKFAKELLRASSGASAEASTEASTEPSLGEDAVRAWAVRWLEGTGGFRDGSETAAVFYGERSPRMLRAESIESRRQELRKKKGTAAPLLADAQFFLAREHGFPSWPRCAEQVRALENAQSSVTSFEVAATLERGVGFTSFGRSRWAWATLLSPTSEWRDVGQLVPSSVRRQCAGILRCDAMRRSAVLRRRRQ